VSAPRIAAVVTARPSWSRVRTALRACRERGLEVHVIAAASACVWKYGKVSDLIREEGFPVTEVSALVEGSSGRASAISTGLLLSQLPLALETLAPQLVITIADRHETIATALAARNLGISLLHLQGGERSGSIDDRIRDAVTCLADIHCVSNEPAARRVGEIRRETGVPWSAVGIHVTGCPSIDLAREALELGPLPGSEGHVIVLQHPVTDEEDQAAAQMEATIDGVERTGLPAHYFWPGEDAGADAMAKVLRMRGLQPTRNMPGLDFLRLLLGARCIVGNSSVAIRECAYLGVPAVNVTSRQRGRLKGRNVIDLGEEPNPVEGDEIADAIHDAPRVLNYISARDPLYGDGRAGERVAEVIAQALGCWETNRVPGGLVRSGTFESGTFESDTFESEGRFV
jgi:UDP-hydrolysing UDP-N-acetyl-D-glucosamine 2-epimerase